MTRGRGHALVPGCCVGAVQENLAHFLGVRPVGHADSSTSTRAKRSRCVQLTTAVDSSSAFGMMTAARWKVCDLRCTDVDTGDVALVPGHLDPVTHLDGPFHHENQARHEVVDDILQAEADADRQGAGDDREVGEIQPQGGDADRYRDGEPHVPGRRT